MLKSFFLLILLSCSTYEQVYQKRNLLLSNAFSNQTSYSMVYKEINSKKIKRVLAKYQVLELQKCFYMIVEKFEIINLSNGQKQFFINTFQFYATSLDANQINVKTENSKRNKKIRFISGNEILYTLVFGYDYSKNALIPYTSSQLDSRDINSFKTRLIRKTAIKFSNLTNAIKAKKILINIIKSCRVKR